MAKKNTNPQGQKQVNKIIPSKKESKKEKINIKKGKKQKPSESSLDEDEEDINEQQVLEDKKEEELCENEEEESGSGEESGSDEDDSEDESSQQSLAPENYAVKQMSFRERRGTKMNYLMNRKKDQEEDPFWQNQGQNYFGNISDEQQDEDYEQSSSGRDQFDSDFGQTESQHSEEQKKVEEPEIDEDKMREKKKQQELMRKIQAPAPKKLAPKANISNKKPQSEKKPVPQIGNRYIHQVCTQQQLLGEAAQTEYINWLSLQKLISLQNEKKDFTHKEHFLEGEKIIFRDIINQNGIRNTSYELVGVQLNKISDLTEIWQKQNAE